MAGYEKAKHSTNILSLTKHPLVRELLLPSPKRHKPAFNFAIARVLQATLTNSFPRADNRANLSRGMRFARLHLPISPGGDRRRVDAKPRRLIISKDTSEVDTPRSFVHISFLYLSLLGLRYVSMVPKRPSIRPLDTERGGARDCTKKEDDSPRRRPTRRSLSFDNNYWSSSGKKETRRNTNQSRDNAKTAVAYSLSLSLSLSMFVNTVLSSREFHLARRYARG